MQLLNNREEEREMSWSKTKSLSFLVALLLGFGTGCVDLNGQGQLVTADAGTPSDGSPGGSDAWSDVARNDSYSTADSSDDAGSRDASADASCSGTICGGSCCPSSKECVQGQCLAACAGTRCGKQKRLCCKGGDLCLGGGCVTPGKKCQRTEDCPVGKICEPTIGKCVPRKQVQVCQYKPPVGKFSPERECNWSPNKGDPFPKRGETEAAPVVANMTDDNGDGKTDTKDTPDLIFLTDDHGVNCCAQPSTIRIVSGKCQADGSMKTLGSISQPVAESSAGIAVGDLNNDGVPEIVAPGRPGEGLIAWKRDKPDGSKWSLYWQNKKHPKWWDERKSGALVNITDLEADGKPDVVVGNIAFNGQNGRVKWNGNSTSSGKGGVGGNAFLGPASAVADVDLDGKREVAAGNTLYDHTGKPLWTYKYKGRNSACNRDKQYKGWCDGFNAVADFDKDPEGEIVIVRLGIVYIINHDGTLYWKQKILKKDCKANESGPPTVADFDGDGQPEVGTAAADYYTVLDPECDQSPVPGKCRQKGILWATPNEDCSSRSTASSVFDFEGDGKAEMVYADEQNFYILDGTTGKILYKDENHMSNTRIEMPLVADVDNDGNSEVVEPAPYGPNAGISVWSDKDDNWVRTRRIWNQHGYSVSNINEDGTVPTKPKPNWRNGRLNNYRQNQQPAGVFDAPDLAVQSIDVGKAQCLGQKKVKVTATVENKGALGVPSGVPVQLSVKHRSSNRMVKSWATSNRLLPGQTETFQTTWTIPTGWLKHGFELSVEVDPKNNTNECKEMNNVDKIPSSKIQLERPDLHVASVSADGSRCRRTGSLPITIKVANRGDQPVPKGTPLLVEATGSGRVRTVKRIKTTKRLARGNSESFSVDWQVTSRFVDKAFDIRVSVDPSHRVYKCDRVNRASAKAGCELGG